MNLSEAVMAELQELNRLQETMEQRLVLIRGIPGSGKSTIAQKVQKKFSGASVHEADMFFISKEGEYKFDPSKIKKAHEFCQTGVENTLRSGNTAIVSNTFVKQWEMEHYFKLAAKYKVPVTILTASGNFKNIHGVPDAIVDRMKSTWEKVNLNTIGRKFKVDVIPTI